MSYLIRSKLFVPATRPELFAKAFGSAADALSLDLQDAVAENRKQEARAAVPDFLAIGASAPAGKTILVRVNSIGSEHFEADLDAVTRAGVDVVNLPDVESAEHVRTAAALMQRLESARRLEHPIAILANIESPKGLRLAAEIAAADPRVMGLQLGFGDLFEPLGIDRTDATAIRQVQLCVRLAAGEAGILAYDGAYADVKNADGFRAEAQAAAKLGYAGKTCIHPSQIAIANDVFRPSDEEIAYAVKVVSAAREAEARGVGAYLIDGKMIDAPFVARAQAVYALARRLGLVA